MKNSNINYIPFKERKNIKNRSNKSLTKLGNTIFPKRVGLSLFGNMRRSGKHKFSSISKKTINSNATFQKDMTFEKNLNENKKISVSIKSFSEIRKQIYNVIKKPYISPYLEHSFIQKKYSDNLQNVVSSVDRGKIYDYYQICYLMNKNIKKYRIITRFKDSLIFADDQEYLMKLFNKEEQYIIMNYLLYQIYDKDQLVVSQKNNKRAFPNEVIVELFNKLKEHNFIFKENYDEKPKNKVIEKNQKKGKIGKSNFEEKKEFLDNLKPILKSKINYIYIKDVPKKLIPNCSPNLFPQSFIQSFNLKIYLKLRKDNISKNIEFIVEDKQKEPKVKSNTKNPDINQKFNKEQETEDNKENICDNISLERNVEEETQDLDNNNFNFYKNIIEKVNENTKDIENFLSKFRNSLYPKKESSKEKISFNLDKLKQQKIKNIDVYNDKKEENKSKNNEGNDSLIENSNKIILNNKMLFSKIAKKHMFKTSLQGNISTYKGDKTTLAKTAKNNFDSKIKDLKQEISSYEYNFHFTRNNKDKIKMINILKKAMYKKKNKYTFLLKTKADSKRLSTKSLYSTEHKRLQNDDSINNKLEKYSNNNLSTKYLQKSNSQTIFQGIRQLYIKNAFDQNISQVNKSQILNLNNFDKLYNETKKQGLLPIPKKHFNSVIHKQFESFTGSNFVDYIIYKGTNKHLEEENKTMNDFLSEKIKKNIKSIQNQDKLFRKFNYSLKTMVKCPNLYWK